MTGQLSLFAGKRQHGRKASPALEFPVHVMIADTLTRWIRPGWVWFHPANGELRDKATAARLKRMGLIPGVSDFVLCGPPNGRMHVLELKRKGKRPTDEQQAFLNAVEYAGGVSAWVDDYKQAIEVLCHWGALPDGKVHVQ